MAKVLCVLHDDPLGGYPKSYARDGIPTVDRYPGGQTAPTPKHIDFKPGELLGSVSGGLGLRKFLEDRGHTFVVTSDKEGATSIFERELPDAEVVISQPFWPAYLTAERIAKAKKLKLAITAGIGSAASLPVRVHIHTASARQPSLASVRSATNRRRQSS
jgi:formate dehydrogenase